jgi:hypothetical protein
MSILGMPSSLKKGSKDKLMFSEAEISKPLLYDQGWGKKQAFCL